MRARCGELNQPPNRPLAADASSASGQIRPMYDVRAYTPLDRNIWDRFVETSKNGTFLFLRDYMDYHAELFEDASVLVTNRIGAVVALFPANRLGTQLVSHGGLSYGGMITDRLMTTSA